MVRCLNENPSLKEEFSLKMNETIQRKYNQQTVISTESNQISLNETQSQIQIENTQLDMSIINTNYSNRPSLNLPILSNNSHNNNVMTLSRSSFITPRNSEINNNREQNQNITNNDIFVLKNMNKVDENTPHLLHLYLLITNVRNEMEETEKPDFESDNCIFL